VGNPDSFPSVRFRARGVTCQRFLQHMSCAASKASNTVTCRGDYRRGFRLDIAFTEQLYTRFVSTITALPLISTIHTNHHNTRYALYQPAVFTSRSPATASNSGDSSASRTLSPLFTDSGTELSWSPQLSFLQLLGTDRADNNVLVSLFRGNVFTKPFPSSGRLFLLIKNLLPSNGRRSVVCF
jgi:hypothetical protein